MKIIDHHEKAGASPLPFEKVPSCPRYARIPTPAERVPGFLDPANPPLERLDWEITRVQVEIVDGNERTMKLLIIKSPT